MRSIRKHLNFANVIACVALFVSLGGASYAAVSLPKNSVGSPQIKKNAVRTGDIARNAVRVGKLAPEAARAGRIAKNAIVTNRLRDNAVTGAKVRDGSLLATDFAPGQLPAGPRGLQGTQGPQGPPGISGYERVGHVVVSEEISAGTTIQSGVACPGGKRPLGGGVAVDSAQDPGEGQHIRNVRVVQSYPTPLGNWGAMITHTYEPEDLDLEWTIWAVCAEVSS